MNLGAYRDVVFLDKYNLEWNLMLASDIRGLIFQGVPIVVRYGKDMGIDFSRSAYSSKVQ